MKKLFQMGQGLALAGSLYAAAVGLTIASADKAFAADVACYSQFDPVTQVYTGCASYTYCSSGNFYGACQDYPWTPPGQTKILCSCNLSATIP